MANDEVSALSDSAQYTKARFFKCALQVNPARYIQYRGQQQDLSEAEYNQQLLNAALEADIKVIGLADHGSVDGADKIRELFQAHGIVVFPGFEIASSEKVHFVCLFDESSPLDLIKMHLGALGVDINAPAAPVNKSASDIIKYVVDKAGFIFAAHCTNDDGVLKRRMNHIWKNESLLAARIPSSLDDLSKLADDGFCQKAFLNKDAHYQRERRMVAINAKDVAKPEDIKKPTASCLIKMTRPCFTSFKQAFLDAESRVRLNSDKPESYASAIERIRFVGGYLDGVNIELSAHLNTVIGGRGTGKSTLLECIRFALDLQPFGKSAQAQHEAILKTNLGEERGLVELTLRSATLHGRQFKVTRKWGDQAVVQDEQGKVSPYQPQDLLPGIALYGQNEIYEMSRDPQSRNRLIKHFLEGEHDDFERKVAEIRHKLAENRAAIIRALDKKNELEAEVERLPKLLDQAQQFKTLGLDEKLKIVPKLEKEKQLKQSVQDELKRVQEGLGVLKDSTPDVAFLSDTALVDLPHAALLMQQRLVLEQLEIGMQQAIQQLEQQLVQAQQALDVPQTELLANIQAEEQKLEQAFKDIPANQGKTGRQIGAKYQTLLKDIEQIRPKQNTLQNWQSQIDELYQQRKKLLLELAEMSSEHSSTLQKAVKRLNRRLDKKLRLTLQNEGDRQPLLSFLEESNMQGVGSRRLAWVCEHDFSPANLAARVREGEAALSGACWGINSPVTQTALTRLSESRLLEMEELVLPDSIIIELNIAHDSQEPVFKAIDALSTGQQCTAVLHLLLLENQDPLILDQPEDNLDNAFIAERIVAELRQTKLNRQFLFATHNANIPVFGDAEWIGVLSVEEGKGCIRPEQQGAIDIPRVQKLAADILEGGKSAFNQRREKYGFE